ncbi:MAG: DUF5908 family protein [Dysgonomonas sp.]|jgi:hypothetical protein|uniref:DUF5908 family protein n=1 Tax=unclassified Dysgonomonas TaxID=2630389 RepID=UPI0025BF9104|nr:MULTISPECIES: DUF5908 family protein [unclassified Dysgonomonas]MDR1714802.1 hypothetical protein [Prevotella sp.]MDR2002465.1 hypothetical protein [Prevotella sp.]HMM02943.1 hypothetical protein [Dysgonomonas sp.]
MAIVIKEINVRTTIERSPNMDKGVSPKDIYQLKREILRDVKDIVKREIKRNSER